MAGGGGGKGEEAGTGLGPALAISLQERGMATSVPGPRSPRQLTRNHRLSLPDSQERVCFEKTQMPFISY